MNSKLFSKLTARFYILLIVAIVLLIAIAAIHLIAGLLACAVWLLAFWAGSLNERLIPHVDEF